MNTIVPFLDSIRATIDLREQITKIEPQPVITRDNVTMEVDAVIYSVIVDPVRATYEVQNLRWGLEQLTLSALRNVIGQLDLDHTLSSRDTTNSQLRAALDSATQQWGVKVMRIELKNITPPEEIRLTMEKQMTAERNRRALVLQADGEKQAAITRAEGEKQAAVAKAEGAKQSEILRAEGEAQARLRTAEAEGEAIRLVSSAIGQHGNPAQYLIMQRYIESLSNMARGQNSKVVFMPVETSAVMSSIGAFKEIFSAEQPEPGATPVPAPRLQQPKQIAFNPANPIIKE